MQEREKEREREKENEGERAVVKGGKSAKRGHERVQK